MFAALAIAGSALFLGTGSVLQGESAQAEPTARTMDPRLLAVLFSRRVFLAGLACNAVGFACSVVALGSMPLFVVQLGVAASVAVTAVISVGRGRDRLSPRMSVMLVAVVGGLALAAHGAVTGPPDQVSPIASLLIVLGAFVLGGVLLFARVHARDSHAKSLVGIGILAGLGYGGCSVAVRAGHFGLNPFTVMIRPLAWAAIAYALVGMLGFVTLLQRTTVTAAAASITVAQTVVPAVLGIVLLGDSFQPGQIGFAIVGFTVATVGAVMLARDPARTRSGRGPISENSGI